VRAGLFFPSLLYQGSPSPQPTKGLFFTETSSAAPRRGRTISLSLDSRTAGQSEESSKATAAPAEKRRILRLRGQGSAPGDIAMARGIVGVLAFHRSYRVMGTVWPRPSMRLASARDWAGELLFCIRDNWLRDVRRWAKGRGGSRRSGDRARGARLEHERGTRSHVPDNEEKAARR